MTAYACVACLKDFGEDMDGLKNHVLYCPKHPLRLIEQQYETKLAELRTELEAERMVNATFFGKGSAYDNLREEYISTAKHKSKGWQIAAAARRAQAAAEERAAKLQKELADANYWRARWSDEATANGQQSQENWKKWKAATEPTPQQRVEQLIACLEQLERDGLLEEFLEENKELVAKLVKRLEDALSV